MNAKRIYASLIILTLFYTTPLSLNVRACSHSINYSVPDDVSSMIISTRKNDIRWKYKIINGILYKRQFNYTTRKWIGKWIKV